MHHDAIVEDHSIRLAHQAVAAGADLQRVERVRVHPIEELDRLRSLDVDLAQCRRVHHRHTLARGPALAQHRRLHVLVMLREVPGPLPLADVLEDGSVRDVPWMHGGQSNWVEEIAAISAGHQTERNRHIRWAECRHADGPDRLAQLRRDDGRFVDAGRLALVAAGADCGEPLYVLDGAHAGIQGAAHVGHRDVALQVDEMRRPIAPIAGDDPVRHDRALAAAGQVAGGRTDYLDVGWRRVRDEARQAFVVSKSTLRLAEEVERRVESTGNAKQVALDLAARTAARECGEDDGANARTLPSPASGGGQG